MTPMQKLVRLAELEKHITELNAQPGAHAGDLAAIQQEREAILASVQGVPDLVKTSDSPEAWARAFTDRYPGVTEDAAETWFDAALLAGYTRGRAEGQVEGAMQAREQHTADKQLVLQRLNLVFALLAESRLRNLSMRGETEGAPPVQLSALIDEAVQAAARL